MTIEPEFWIFMISLLKNFSGVVSFFAPIVGGENAVLMLAFLSAQGYLSLYNVIFFSFLGMLAIDSIWFLAMKTKLSEKFKKFCRISKKYRNLEKKIEKISHKNDIFILLISKVLIGTRILILAYLNLRNMSYKTFMKYNIIPTFIWASILGAIGWFAGMGYYNLNEMFNNISAAIIFSILIIGIFYLILRLIRKWIEK